MTDTSTNPATYEDTRQAALIEARKKFDAAAEEFLRYWRKDSRPQHEAALLAAFDAYEACRHLQIGTIVVPSIDETTGRIDLEFSSPETMWYDIVDHYFRAQDEDGRPLITRAFLTGPLDFVYPLAATVLD